MKTIDKINDRIRRLPERSRKEVLDFVEFLLSKSGKIEEGMDNKSWSGFSLKQAMRGLEFDEMFNYTESDIKEKYKK